MRSRWVPTFSRSHSSLAISWAASFSKMQRVMTSTGDSRSRFRLPRRHDDNLVVLDASRFFSRQSDQITLSIEPVKSSRVKAAKVPPRLPCRSRTWTACRRW